jgi:hypothetical protein
MGIITNDHSVQYLFASFIWSIATCTATERSKPPQAPANIENFEELINLVENGVAIFKKSEPVIINKSALNILESEGVTQDQLKECITKVLSSKTNPLVLDTWSHLRRLIGNNNSDEDANFLAEYKSKQIVNVDSMQTKREEPYSLCHLEANSDSQETGE